MAVGRGSWLVARASWVVASGSSRGACVLGGSRTTSEAASVSRSGAAEVLFPCDRPPRTLRAPPPRPALRRLCRASSRDPSPCRDRLGPPEVPRGRPGLYCASWDVARGATGRPRRGVTGSRCLGPFARRRVLRGRRRATKAGPAR